VSTRIQTAAIVAIAQTSARAEKLVKVVTAAAPTAVPFATAPALIPRGRTTSIAAVVSKRGLVVLISDLLTPVESLEKNLGYLRSRGHEVLLIRVLDPAELTFTFPDPAMFRDVESGRQLYIDPETARESYLEKFNVHLQVIQKTCSNLGVEYCQVATDQPLELVLFDFVSARMKRGSGTMTRRASNPAAGGAR
jgi:uncharacterized protein (DUF58 family)